MELGGNLPESLKEYLMLGHGTNDDDDEKDAKAAT
jgi:hypothetical protein